MATNYTERIAVPSPASINSGLTYCRLSTQLGIFGPPRPGAPPVDCAAPTNEKLKREIVYGAQVHRKFKVSGNRKAVESLKRIFAKVDKEHPELYELIGTAGMICCRAIRGSKTNWSNHSFGTAIDLTIGGILDNVADGKCLQGLLDLYRYFHEEGWYWGSEFSREDSMHFEVADETIRKWYGAA